MHSLVHRDLWSPAGPTFVAKRAKPNVEFLSSSDNWFRPVNFYIGPGTGIYVLDYYRKMIERPFEWMAKDAGEGKDLYDGKDKGRLYYLTPSTRRSP